MTSHILSILALLASLVLSAELSAQTQSASQPATFFQAAGVMFALSVPDLDESVAWFRDKLGLHITMRIPRNDQTRAAIAILQGGGLTVELIKHDDATPSPAQSSSLGAMATHGIAKVGFEVGNFDSMIDSLRTRGVRFAMGPFPKRDDQPANVILRDNAGNMIQIIGR